MKTLKFDGKKGMFIMMVNALEISNQEKEAIINDACDMSAALVDDFVGWQRECNESFARGIDNLSKKP